MGARPAKIAALRSLIADTGWAILFLNDKDPEVINKEELDDIQSSENFLEYTEKRDARKKDPKASSMEEAEARQWIKILNYLETFNYSESSLCELGGYLIPRDDGTTLAHNLLFLPNIAEYQARQVAEACGVKHWVTPKAMFEGKKRIPCRGGLRFLQELSHTPADWEGAHTSPMTRYRTFVASHPALQREPGLFCLCHFARLLAAKSEGSDYPERLQNAVNALKASRARGLTTNQIMERRFDIKGPDELVTAFIMLTEEEVNTV
jgi:hypothetical protein